MWPGASGSAHGRPCIERHFFDLFSLAQDPVLKISKRAHAVLGSYPIIRMAGITPVREMGSAWALTFPGCGLIGYLMALLFLKIF